MNIIDAHIHFWDINYLSYPWLEQFPDINQTTLPSDLPSSGDGWTMEKLVFVQADCVPEDSLDEVRWVTDLAANDERIAGIVAYAPLEKPNVYAQIDALQSNPLVKGVRRLIQGENIGFALNEQLIESVRRLEKYDMSFDICVFHHQLPDVIGLVNQCPNVRFVLDHMGKPDIADGRIGAWSKNITTLAAFDNVHCKISGIVTEADWFDWQPEDLQPYIDHVLETFGPERLIFGGDFPVLRLANTTYPQWVSTVIGALSDLSQEEQHQIFYENAAVFYRL